LDANRYQDKKEEAWKWDERLRDAALKNINYRHYIINT